MYTQNTHLPQDNQCQWWQAKIPVEALAIMASQIMAGIYNANVMLSYVEY